MKRLSLILIFSVVLSVFFAVGVRAEFNWCDPAGVEYSNDTILTLYTDSNSHGAIWNDTNQQATSGAIVKICYSSTFGINYANAHPSENVHACKPGNANLILSLSSISNAHANGPQSTPYSVPVCYGDLVCTLKSTDCNLAVNEREIVSLYSPTNSHLEIKSSNKYTYRICCTSQFAGVGGGGVCGNGVVEAGEQCDGSNLNGATCNSLGYSGGTLGCIAPGQPNQCRFDTSACTGGGSIGEVHWEDFNGNRIGRSVGIGTSVNKTVRMIANTGFNAGATVNFQVREKDILLNPDDTIRIVSAQTDSSGKAVATFKITDIDIANGDDDFPGTWNLEFYFIASAGSSSNQSEIVDVNKTEGPNIYPVANITAPIHREVYYNGTTVLFNQSSYDIESGITLNWTIAEDNYRDSRSSFSYTFTKPGMKTITLRATDDKGLWDEDEIGILVVASPGMLAYINSPFHREVVPKQSSGVLALVFAAQDSFVIDNNVINAGTCNTGVTCVAGPCPNQTQNSPAYCGGGPVAINGGPKTFANTEFDWTVGNDAVKYKGTGDGYAVGSRVFSASQAGAQTASLSLNYNSGGISLNQTTNRLFTIGQCVDNGHTFIRINLLTGKETSRGSTTSSEYCTGQNGAVGGGDDCCPAGFACGTTGGVTKCYGANEDSCSDFTTQTTCVNANPVGFPEYSQSRCGEIVNGNVIDCECSWKTSDSSCFLNVTSHPGDACGGDSCTNPPTNYQCLVLDYTEHECINGYADVDITRFFIPGTGPGAITDPNDVVPPCINQTITGVLCGRPSFDLDAASNWNIIIAGLFIAGIYIVIYAFRKNGK